MAHASKPRADAVRGCRQANRCGVTHQCRGTSAALTGCRAEADDKTDPRWPGGAQLPDTARRSGNRRTQHHRHRDHATSSADRRHQADRCATQGFAIAGNQFVASSAVLSKPIRKAFQHLAHFRPGKLGLTAGIAHEIKNPLNFINNFASLSVDLLDELKQTAAPGLALLDEARRTEVDEIASMLASNLNKINDHGRRADGIVRGMLEHSRGSSGERREIDLNALVDEALNLAYHGARAQDQSFNVTLQREFGEIGRASCRERVYIPTCSIA